MKTKTTLAALLLAAVMVTPSYGADEMFLDGAADYFDWKETNQIPIDTGKVKYFLETVDTFINRLQFPQPKSYPQTLDREELHFLIAEYVVRHPENHDYVVLDLICIAISAPFQESKD